MILLLFVASAFSLSSSYKNVVISQNGSDNITTCLEGLSPCRSISFAATHLSENNIVFQVDGVVSIVEAIEFHSPTNITIIGITHHSELVCPHNCSTCGLVFFHGQSIALQKVIISGCGAVQNFSSQGLGIPYKSAVILYNCSDISFVNVTVRDSLGHGVVLVNSAGEVTVSHSYFLNSTMLYNVSEMLGGAGMHIVVSFCDILASSCDLKQLRKAHYNISHSVFNNSNVTSYLVKPWSLAYGGGLGILLWWGASSNNITITGSVFAGNHCPCGSGVSLMCNKNSADNQFLVRNSIFVNNSESYSKALGGAGAAVGFSSNYRYFPLGNNITFKNCNFTRNMGYYGAGTLVYSAAAGSNITMTGSNTLHFTECVWEHNSGVVSPALDIGPDFLGTYEASFIANISLHTCHFFNNYVISSLKNFKYHSALGVLLIAQLSVYFSGNTHFENNEGSALALFSAHIIFGDGSVATFMNNTGRTGGGALVLYEYSTMRYWNNTHFNFTNNKALFMGGAIFVIKYSEHEKFSSHDCFMHYGTSTGVVYDFLNVHFYFENNMAGYGFAHSIYANTVRPCQQYCAVTSHHFPSAKETFTNQSCLGYFHFKNSSNQVGTEGTDLKLIRSPPYDIIPGRKFQLPLKITDEFGNSAIKATEFRSIIKTSESEITLDPAYLFVTNNTVTLNGNPGAKGELYLIGTRSNDEIRMEIQLVPCAPGYVSDLESSKNSRCVCSAIYSDKQYPGIVECNDSAGVALIAPGMWAGYVTNETANENNLYTGFCVHGYCKDFSINMQSTKLSELWPNASQSGLEKVVCANNRHGILCGKCTTNHSVYYHSSTYSCQTTTMCALGPLFYILSEILPTAILFLIILFFNIELTSGTAYSLIFMVHTLQAMGVSLVGEPGFQRYLIEIAIMIYNTLNINFFALEELSFCLWDGASSLDMLIMKYVTVVFALGLIVSAVLLVNYCNCAKISRHRICRNRQISFVKGLSAFLVICYSQCVAVTFYILNPAIITGKGGIPYNTTVVYLDGSVPYFSSKHLLYAIPALMVLTVIVIPLSVVLFGDQFFLKLEYTINQFCCRRKNSYPWTQFRQKFKPLFDSFQGCFKDEYRFMSGLFFIYRIVFLLVLVISPRLDWFYGLEQFVLIVIFTVQALLQPFQTTKHNVVAVLVFFLLSLINCSCIIIYLLIYASVRTNAVYVFQWLRLVLVYLPIIFGLGWCMWRACKWAHSKTSKHSYSDITEQDHLDESAVLSLNRSS